MDLMGDLHDVLTSDERSQLEAFLATYRELLAQTLDGLTEDEVRQRLVPSKTTLLGLVKHAAYVERIWFFEAVTGRSRQELDLPATVDESYDLDDADRSESILENFRSVCAESSAAVSGLALEDVVTGHRFGAINLRWIYLHLIREYAHHCGHADILREQVLATRRS